MNDDTIMEVPLRELRGLLSTGILNLLQRNEYQTVQQVRDAQERGALDDIPQMGPRKLAQIRRTLARLDGTYLPDLREAAEGVLAAYQVFLNRDDLEQLRDALTDLQQALDGTPVPPVRPQQPAVSRNGEYAPEPLFPASAEPAGVPYPYRAGTDSDLAPENQPEERPQLPPEENPHTSRDFADYDMTGITAPGKFQ